MGTDNPTPPSYDEEPESMESNALSEGDEIKQEKALIEHLESPTTLQEFKKGCKNIGQTAVTVDGHFKTVRAGLTELVKKYGRDFPAIEQVHVPKWNTFIDRWDGKKGLLWSSRDFASKTVEALEDYEENLTVIEQITTEKHLKGAQAELRGYIERHPIHSATELADGFKDLSRDVGGFAKEFKDYMEEQGQTLTQDAQRYEDDMARYQAEVDKFNKKIEAAAKSLSCAGILGILAVIPLVNFLKLIGQRNKALANRNEARANLDETTRKQQALASMQTDFEKFKPNIEDICFKLGIFAGIWAFVTSQSVQLNASLEGGLTVATDTKFLLRLKKLRAQIKPLTEGLNAYAVQIVSRSNT